MQKIRVGLIGTGYIAHLHAKQLMELQEVEITAVASTGQERRAAFLSEHGLRNVGEFTDYRVMLSQCGLDAVVICSPHNEHFRQATDALNAGLHVLVEKPMTCSSGEARQLIDTAESAGKVLQVSYQRHFEPAFLYIKEVIESGTVGKLTSITASLYQEWKQLTKGIWRQMPDIAGGGMLMDSGSHILDVLLWTTGMTPVEVSAKLHNQGAPVEIDSFTSIRFKEGPVAGVNVIGFAPCWHETYVFCGEDGAIFYDNGQITLRFLGKDPVVPELPPQAANPDRSFIESILGNREPAIPGAFALKVIELTEMIYQAGGYVPSKKTKAIIDK